MRVLLLVFTGGGLGSVLRYLMSRWFNETMISAFPFGTFVVNIIGCFFIGFVIFYTERYGEQADTWRLFLATGLCGGFTTFSAFSLENAQLISDQRILIFLLYTAGSVILGLLATYLGLLAGRGI